MPNVAFQLEVLSQVKNPPPAPPFQGFSTFAGLGAIGPDLYQYFPINAGLSATLQTIFTNVQGGASVASQFPLTGADASELTAKPLMAAYSLLFSALVVPFWGVLQREADVLNKLQTIATSSDSSGLTALLSAFSGDLATVMTNDATQLQKLAKASAAYLAIAPQFVNVPPPIQTSAPATPWVDTGDRPYEFLRWHKTRTFTQNLVKNASTANQNDYVTGYLCHVASSVTGEPFINNIAGGPYRTHWWRNRFVANFVDGWLYGRYNGVSVDPTTNAPSVAYSDPSFPDIRQSNLWNLLDVAGLGTPAIPNTLPAVIDHVGKGSVGGDALTVETKAPDIVKLLSQTITQTWPLHRPAAFATGSIDKATTESVVGLLAVVWFMTSGFGPMTPFTLGPQPPGGTPSWVTTVSSGGSVSIPPPTSSGPSTGATVCGVILAILGAIALAFQQYGAGAALVAGAIAEFASGGGIDFGQLASDVWALRQLLLTAETDLDAALALAGLSYPIPSQLGRSVPGPTPGSLIWIPANANNLGVTSKGGTLSIDVTPLTKSNPGASYNARVALFKIYPLQVDASNPNGADADFNQFPPIVEETPATMNLPQPLGYVDMVLDGSPPQTPLPAANPGIFTPGPYPNPSANTYFFDAVSNANQLIAQGPDNLPNYNLDADRGYGWINWNPKEGTFPNSGNVDAVPELDI